MTLSRLVTLSYTNKPCKSAKYNSKCMAENIPLFGFIPIYGLKCCVYNRVKTMRVFSQEIEVR